MLSLIVNGSTVEVPDVGETLLAVLRDRLGITSAKDGCSPQGQCGCCTVLVDGSPRVACVTPARRVRGRSVQTLEGLEDDRVARWGEALCAAGGSQCGFCTPGIVMRLDALSQKESDDADSKDAVDQALLAHLCRCTGWQTIHEAWELFTGSAPIDGGGFGADRNPQDAATRAGIEGRAPQVVSPEVALGRGGFAADTAPDDALIAVFDGQGGWVVGESLSEARVAAGKVQGRRTTAQPRWPLEVPDGGWDATLRTTWVDAAYLETDASWCRPGGEPYSTVANGGAFGAKDPAPTPDRSRTSDPDPNADPASEEGAGALDVRSVARRLADENDRPVLVLASREDTAARAPKRPPVAGGMNADGSGILRVVATPGIAEAVAAVAPGLQVEEIAVVGPPTSASARAAGWAEATVLVAGATGELGVVRSPEGAEAEAVIENGTIKVAVSCGRSLDRVVLRSYCIGAAHMAWSWLTSEAMVVDEQGTVHDLTVRSFGVLRAIDTPPIEIDIIDSDRSPVNGSDAVFAAVAAAGWLANDCAQDWPIANT